MTLDVDTTTMLVPPISPRLNWPFVDDDKADRPAQNAALPRITIVTPSYNQGAFIEATIRSILLQGYPNLQYIVADGGSTDDTREVLEHYRSAISTVIIEPDKGQADAINKGLSLADGDIFHWVNSDDFLLPGALSAIANAWVKRGTSDCVAGGVANFGESLEIWGRSRNVGISLDEFYRYCCGFPIACDWHQPGCWFGRNCYLKQGGVSVRYGYHFDRYFMLQYLADGGQVTPFDETLVMYRIHGESKSSKYEQTLDADLESILQHFAGASKANARSYHKFERIMAWKREIKTILSREAPPSIALARLLIAAMREPSIRFNRGIGTRAAFVNRYKRSEVSRQRDAGVSL
jgi:glycosyltransferase involved in cell wall biosynthesis